MEYRYTDHGRLEISTIDGGFEPATFPFKTVVRDKDTNISTRLDLACISCSEAVLTYDAATATSILHVGNEAEPATWTLEAHEVLIGVLRRSVHRMRCHKGGAVYDRIHWSPQEHTDLRVDGIHHFVFGDEVDHVGWHEVTMDGARARGAFERYQPETLRPRTGLATLMDWTTSWDQRGDVITGIIKLTNGRIKEEWADHIYHRVFDYRGGMTVAGPVGGEMLAILKAQETRHPCAALAKILSELIFVGDPWIDAQ